MKNARTMCPGFEVFSIDQRISVKKERYVSCHQKKRSSRDRTPHCRKLVDCPSQLQQTTCMRRLIDYHMKLHCSNHHHLPKASDYRTDGLCHNEWFRLQSGRHYWLMLLHSPFRVQQCQSVVRSTQEDLRHKDTSYRPSPQTFHFHI